MEILVNFQILPTAEKWAFDRTADGRGNDVHLMRTKSSGAPVYSDGRPEPFTGKPGSAAPIDLPFSHGNRRRPGVDSYCRPVVAATRCQFFERRYATSASNQVVFDQRGLCR